LTFMITLVVGLGLIGGSIARRLRGFHDTKIIGVDKNSISLQSALADGVIDEGYPLADGIVEQADFVILCLYPQANIAFARQYARDFKKGAVITDVSGVKETVVKEISEALPPDVDFVGGHPMAGREVGGYQSSTDTLFDGASYLFTPTQKNHPESVSMLREFAEYIGCSHVVTTSPEEHDAMIAYTSQLMHVVAVALCNHPMLERSAFFSAGSLRDCTRIAVINEKMWSELFLENKNALMGRIEEFCETLQQFRDALASDDRDALEEMMRIATRQKQTWLMEKQN